MTAPGYTRADRNLLIKEGPDSLSPYYTIAGTALLLRDAAVTCPLCNSGHLAAPTTGLTRFINLRSVTCDSCGATFKKTGNRYALSSLADRKSPILAQYRGEPLRLEEWERIGKGGLSDAQQRKTDLEEWLEQLRLGRVPVTCINAPLSILPHKGEHVLCALPQVLLYEPRAVRRSAGLYGGPRVRVAKGLYVNLGGFGSSSRSYSELRKVDSGILTITNQRIVFSGALKTLNIEFSKILNMQPYEDGVALHRSSSQRTQYFSWGKNVRLEIATKGKTYQASLTGVVMQYLIEGLTRR